MSRIVRVFDTTLRDGEQSPGVNLNTDEKVQIAKQLERLGVGVMEAGFPIASPGDFDSVRAVADSVTKPMVAGLCRAVEKDIVRAWEAVKDANKPMIHTFVSTSPIHMHHKLRKSPDEVLAMAIQGVKLAKSLCPSVEFSAEDATRSDWDFLSTVLTEVIVAGATVINVPDTVGYTMPEEFARLLRYLKEKVWNIDQAILSVHCHNDLGLAVANTLTAVMNGAGQVECTINGIGERAGNAALEEIAMAIRTRAELMDCDTEIVSEQISRTSRLVSSLTGLSVQANKAVVGDNAFAHESGIHVDGFLKERTTYEIMTPESIGLSSSRLVLGKHSGRHAFRSRCDELGYSLTDAEVDKAYAKFIELADKKREVSDRDIEAMIEVNFAAVEEYFRLEYLHFASGMTTVPTATVRIGFGDVMKEEAACGDGPVDAVYRAIDRITDLGVSLMEYHIKAVTGGKDALGEVTVRVADTDGRVFRGRGNSTDVIEASARAYMHAINKLVAERKVGAARGNDAN